MPEFSLGRHELGDGLVMRPASLADRDALTEFNATVFGGPSVEPDEQAAAWTRDLLRGDHPTSPISDHSIIEDTTTGQIVSSCLLISQNWTYDRVPFAIGRPELVGTHPAYRSKGLIAKQFDRLHRISAERGQLVQALTGIPNFYRRVGYEPALQVAPTPIGPASAFEALPVGDHERFRFRTATDRDLPLIVKYYDQSTRRSTIAAIRDEAFWRYELSREPLSDYIHEFVVIETEDGTSIGILAHLNQIRHHRLSTTLVEIRDDIGWHNVAEPIMRFLRTRAEMMGQAIGESFPLVGFDLVPDHPLVRLTSSRLPSTKRGFSWDIRVPDLIAFLKMITPVLERRLAASFLVGYSGMFEATLYQSGFQMRFSDGRISSIESWRPASIWRTEVAIPEKAFLYLLFGSRSLDEIEIAFPDCRIKTDVARVMIETLFPRTSSVIWPIG